MTKKSFTLIETIVVVAVIGLTLPILFTIILTLMREQVKVYRLSQAKRDGDYLINLMENTIRNSAITIHSSKPVDDSTIVCQDAANSPSNISASYLYFLDKNNQWFGFALSGNSVTSDSANLVSPTNLTSSKTIVTDFSIYCLRNTNYSPPAVSFSFNICYNVGDNSCNSTRPEEISSLHYQTTVKLTSY